MSNDSHGVRVRKTVMTKHTKEAQVVMHTES